MTARLLLFTDRHPPALRYLRTVPRAAGGHVYLNAVRIAPERVEELIAFHAQHAAKTGDWTAHDAWMSARDGINEPPLSAAERAELALSAPEPMGAA